MGLLEHIKSTALPIQGWCLLGRATKIGAAIVLLLLVLGIGCHIYQLSEAGRAIRVKRLTVHDISIIKSGIGIPTGVRVDVSLEVSNPTQFMVDIERLTYVIYVEGEYIGEGTEYNLIIPAGGTASVRATLEVSIGTVISKIIEAIRAVSYTHLTLPTTERV